VALSLQVKTKAARVGLLNIYSPIGIALLVASLMIFAVPVLAGDGMCNPVAESGQQGG
jgi:hypothetical protein